jgi:hypothetical protein
MIIAKLAINVTTFWFLFDLYITYIYLYSVNTKPGTKFITTSLRKSLENYHSVTHNLSK